MRNISILVSIHENLYDLLGALPDDDADGLRAAFRKAAKANHPDNNPENPEASERFRKIVRANAILSDGQQRAAYDRLLEVARQQQGRKPKRTSMVRRLAADAAASAVVSVLLIGGYLLYRPFDKLPPASAPVTEASARKAAQAPIVKAAELSEAHGQVEQHGQAEQHDQATQHHQAEQHDQAAQHDKLEVAGADLKPDISPRDVKEPAKPDGVAPAVTTGIAPASASLPQRSASGPKMPSIIENGASRRIAAGIYILRLSISIWRSTWTPIYRTPTSIAALSSIAWAI